MHQKIADEEFSHFFHQMYAAKNRFTTHEEKTSPYLFPDQSMAHSQIFKANLAVSIIKYIP